MVKKNTLLILGAILFLGVLLFSVKLPFSLGGGILGGEGAGFVTKLQMNDTVATGEPLSVLVWVEGKPDVYPWNPANGCSLSPYDCADWTLRYEASLIIASIDGVRGNIHVQEAYDSAIRTYARDVVVLTNGIQDISPLGGSGSRFIWAMEPPREGFKLMKITVGSFATEGTHTLNVQFPCQAYSLKFSGSTEIPYGIGNNQYFNTYSQQADQYFGTFRSPYCTASKTFVVSAPLTVQITSTTSTVSNVTGESVTTTYLTTSGATITNTESNSTGIPASSALVVNDIQNTTVTTSGENITTIITTGAAQVTTAQTGISQPTISTTPPQNELVAWLIYAMIGYLIYRKIYERK